MLASFHVVCVRFARCIVIRFLIAAVVLLGAAHAQVPSPWIGTATDGAPRPSLEERACSKEFDPLRQEARKRLEETRAASEQHAQSGAECKAYGRFIEAEERLISHLQSKADCQRPFFVLDEIRTGYVKNVLVKERVCSAPGRPHVGLHEILTAEPPPLPKNPLRF
jgi:hypothetical protein